MSAFDPLRTLGKMLDSKVMRSLLTLVACATLASCNLTPKSLYVPSAGWSIDGVAEQYASWFGSQLQAMGERPFYGLRATDNVFRLLVLPNDQPGYSYRVELAQHGHVLHWVLLDGAGGYSPGRVAKRGFRTLTSTEAAIFDKALESASLGTQPRDGRPAVDEDAVVIFHCTHYVFERARGLERTFVHRRCSPEEPELSDLITLVRGFQQLDS